MTSPYSQPLLVAIAGLALPRPMCRVAVRKFPFTPGICSAPFPRSRETSGTGPPDQAVTFPAKADRFQRSKTRLLVCQRGRSFTTLLTATGKIASKFA